MTWQEPVVALAVGAAVTYLVWKLGFSGRPKPERRDPGPDVSADSLTKKSKGRRR